MKILKQALSEIGSNRMSNKFSKILVHTLVLIIPDRNSNGSRVDSKAITGLMSDRISNIFGGLTIQNGSGVWQNAKGKLVQEKNKYISVSFSADQLAEILAIVLDFAGLLFNKLGQEAIAFEIDGKLIVSPKVKGYVESHQTDVELKKDHFQIPLFQEVY